MGVDGFVEIIDAKNRQARGRIFALQIKCGTSFFQEEKEDGYVFRGEMKHLRYWLDYSLPVVLVLCHPVTRECFWVQIASGAVQLHEKNWSVLVPNFNKFDESCKERILWTVRGPIVEDVISSSLYRLLNEKYRNVEIAPVCATPQDFMYFDELAEIDDVLHLVTYLYKPAEQFSASDIKQIMDKATVCASCCGWNTFNVPYNVLVILVALDIKDLHVSADFEKEMAKYQNLKTVRAVCSIGLGGGLTEIDDNDSYVVVLERGAPEL
ncbi:hypothetical protein C7I85_30165 [Mesorhizobium soli]|uniref:DUF4365 domain-containing protein n=1 Tax=Pseudaminobacter soli (ex Li et al. 2025) TaxID=1295366 RepID=A0A2P7RIE8_9HYPH|nr:hypothetical protein C7I85_30165 [Mesorhizobium soli]